MSAPVKAAALAILIVAAPLGAWGAKGHRIASALALRTLPREPRAWFEGREDYLLDHASDPDRWGLHDPKEKRRHFINTETYGGPEGVPFDQEEARAMVGGREFYAAGQAPWIIQDRWRDLVGAFRAGNREQVALAAAALGHYVADLHVPLHTTRNHDGQETGQRGVHARWESSLVERFVEEGELKVAPAEDLPEGDVAPWGWMKESNALLPQLLADDREAEKSGLGRRKGAYWQVFGSLEGAVVKRQLERSGQRFGDLILMAWEKAGRPAAPKA
ncbi:MAG TPA: hypothetical protein VJ483_00380 [Holophagaceae bacterium]|nr:hypothetical protein [Holophagaceae bacterium]